MFLFTLSLLKNTQYIIFKGNYMVPQRVGSVIGP